MNKSLLVGLIVGAGATAGVGALAGLTLKGNHEAPARILPAEPSAAPVTEDARLGRAGAPPVLATAALPERTGEAVPAPVTPPVPPAPQILKAVHTEPRYARVVRVQPVTRTVSEPREVCNDVEVVKQAPVRDQHQIAGTVIGGVLGGVIGNQIGNGDGRKIARIAGAIGGAYAGNKAQERIQSSRTMTTTETKCETVYEPREQPDGYEVTYEWNGAVRTVKMATDPGSHLPVRGGDVVLASHAN